MAINAKLVKDYAALLMKYGTRDCFQIAKHRGIDIETLELPKGILGVTSQIFEKTYILLDSNISIEMARRITTHAILIGLEDASNPKGVRNVFTWTKCDAEKLSMIVGKLDHASKFTQSSLVRKNTRATATVK